MESNFEFLRSLHPDLAELGAALEYAWAPELPSYYAGAVESMLRRLIWRGLQACGGYRFDDPVELEGFQVVDSHGRAVVANPDAAPSSRATLAELIECCRELLPGGWKKNLQFVADWLEGVRAGNRIQLLEVDLVLRALHGLATWLGSVSDQVGNVAPTGAYVPLVELLVRRCHELQSANNNLCQALLSQEIRQSVQDDGKPNGQVSLGVELASSSNVDASTREESQLMSSTSEPMPANSLPAADSRATGNGHPLIEVPGLDGPVKLIIRLGAGGMGTVWKGFHEELGVVAVKQLRTPFPVVFHREVAALRAAQHPNVIRLHAAGMHPEAGAWIVMEYAGGGCLTKVISERPGVESLALRYMRQVLAGLAHLHRLGLVHRDIKPANLLLDCEGNVKVADMGLARPVGHGATVTMSGAAVGTPWYMSPEQIGGTNEISCATDVWSAGVVFYELLRGEQLFSAHNPLLAAYEVKTKDLKLSSKLFGKSPKVIAWLERCLERRAVQRFPDAGQALVALENALGNG